MGAASRMMRLAEGQYFSPTRMPNLYLYHDLMKNGDRSGLVSTLDDISGSGRTGTGGTSGDYRDPNHANAINGYGAVEFNGTDDAYDYAAGVLGFKHSEAFHIMTLARYQDADGYLLAKFAGATYPRWYWFFNGAAVTNNWWFLGGDLSTSRLYCTFDGDPAGTPSISEAAYDGGAVASGMDAILNGSLLTRTVVNDTGPTSFANSDTGALGDEGGSSSPWEGQMSIVLVWWRLSGDPAIDPEHAYRVRRWMGQLGGIEISGGPVTL